MALPFLLPPHLPSISSSSSLSAHSLPSPSLLKATVLSLPRSSFHSLPSPFLLKVTVSSLPRSSSSLVSPNSFVHRPPSWQCQTLPINRNVVDASVTSTPGEFGNLQYQVLQFRDEGSDLELRLQLHKGHGVQPLSAKDILVDAQESSLTVAAQTTRGVRTLLARSRLYGRIKPSETIWFIDENEVVFSLKKADKELIWPGLLENWETLCLGVPKLLKGIPVYIVGNYSNTNWVVAQELAMALGYTPIQTKQLLEELTKHSIADLEAAEEDEGVMRAENEILASLNTHVRVIVATLGGKQGVASQPTNWKHLYGGICIWLAQSSAQDKYAARDEAMKAKQEGIAGYSKADTFVALGSRENGSPSSAAEGGLRAAAEACLRSLKGLLDANKDLPGKKNLYIRLGCRGDWPDIMPPGWNPNPKNENVKQAYPVQAGVL